ncbi:hypothetical protein [Prevotella sp. E2-28]|uniref:hypothetical protein n=1 Tax=Prevotella sp. E2-28 TaxID=2913620 RepID=UPI001EDA0A91|nr:hypothetical protein [Prevotella sp. E2-28]UKK52696.1 hypothetical protein L6465_08770 [Prevotella sp. E2-28]
MNKDLLFQLYAIHSPSGNEKRMRKFLKKYIWANCGEVKIEQDEHGNLLCTKGESDTYPCLASHIDQVQDHHSKDFKVFEYNGDVFAWSAKSHEQQGLGADDKNGIFICLELLKKFDVMKVAFFVGEEVGCKGSSAVDLGFFKDCRFIVEPDRRGGGDLITEMSVGKVCSDDFIAATGYKEFGYTFARGTITDVGELVERGVGISCLNLSCGYYDAHTDNEMTILDELENCLALVNNIVENCTDVYPFKYEPYDYGRFNYGGYRGGCGSYQRGLLYGYQGTSKKDSSKDIESFNRSFYDDYDDDNEDTYVQSGYYDQDVFTMEEYLRTDINTSFDLIFETCLSDFNVEYFYMDIDIQRDILKDVYDAARDNLLESGEYEEPDDDTSENPTDSNEDKTENCGGLINIIKSLL